MLRGGLRAAVVVILTSLRSAQNVVRGTSSQKLELLRCANVIFFLLSSFTCATGCRER